MKKCHKCKHDAEVKAGKYKGVPFRLTPCGKCAWRENSAHTKEYDDEKVYAAGPVCKVWDTCHGEEEADPLMPMSVLTSAVSLLLRLTPKTFAVIGMRLDGMPYKEIARRQHSTMAATEALLRRAMSKHPDLKSLLVLKAEKQKWRRRSGSGGAAPTAAGKIGPIGPRGPMLTKGEGVDTE